MLYNRYIELVKIAFDLRNENVDTIKYLLRANEWKVTIVLSKFLAMRTFTIVLKIISYV